MDKLITDITRSRIATARKIASGVLFYTNTIGDYIRGTDPESYQEMLNALQRVYSDTIPEFTADDPITSISALYDYFTQLETDMEIMLALFTNPVYIQKALQVTVTMSINIYKERARIFSIYDEYMASVDEMDKRVFNAVANLNVNRATIMSHALSPTNINAFTVWLIGEAIVDATPAERAALNKMLSARKDSLLGATRVVDGNQWVVRYGLVPGIAQSLTSILEEISSIPGCVDITAAASSGPGIVLLSLPAGTSMTFNISGLIDIDYATRKDIITNSVVGVNKKVLERLRTIMLTQLPDEDVATPPRTGVYPGADVSHYFVILYDGSAYRLMRSGTGSRSSSIIDAAQILGLIHGQTTKPAAYNELHADIILTSIYDPMMKTTLSAYSVAKMSKPSSDMIRDGIVIALTDDFMKRYDAHTPSTEKQVHMLAINTLLIEETLSLLLIPVVTKNYVERMATAITKVDEIIFRFIRELEDRWRKTKINARMFKEMPTRDLREQINGIFKTTTTAAVNELDRLDVWTTMELSVKEFYFEHRGER